MKTEIEIRKALANLETAWHSMGSHKSDPRFAEAFAMAGSGCSLLHWILDDASPLAAAFEALLEDNRRDFAKAAARN